ncbi:unnamed protein product [Phytophthora lilii]|uniref:Unnamed protein product n=1 Tax=Phytophthora lilii TaxID=2077276 RepID=A0A9W6TJD5_9STRA|nr:unnamed protein product [Phytophthora lilii]
MAKKGGSTRDRAPPDKSKSVRRSTQPPQLLDYEVSYGTCVAIFVIVLFGISVIPLKEYYLGSYVTKALDEVRDEVVARQLSKLGVVINSVHYFDTFDRNLLPLIDCNTKAELTRSATAALSLTEFLACANIRRADLLDNLPGAILTQPVNIMVDVGIFGDGITRITNDVAEAIVELYRDGMSVADVVALLPGSFDNDHVALVDVLGVSAILNHYLESQQLSVGVNVNGEAAILAEVTHATASFCTPDFLINTIGMHLVSTMHLAPFWNCAIKHTTMNKSIAATDVDEIAVKGCGSDVALMIPTLAVNLMLLFQKDERDYTELDNTTIYTLGRQRESATDFVALQIPETLEDSALFSMDGSKWKKSRVDASASTTFQTTPYGYLYTPDCRSIVDLVMQQGGRNVQKYQAYIGDGLGNCAFRDSQETELQTLCRLFMTSNKVIFRVLNGSFIELPSCLSMITADSSTDIQALEQNNLRQIEWFLVDSAMLTRRIRIHDNTSRQIRTFLLILNLIGASHYAVEYIFILKSVWIFIRNSVYRPAVEARSLSRVGSLDVFKNAAPLVQIGIFELLQCDPADGALGHPGTMVLLYLGAIGSLSNIFSLSSVHCAAGAHGHLRTIKWYLESNGSGGVTTVSSIPKTAQIIPAEMHRVSRERLSWAATNVLKE